MSFELHTVSHPQLDLDTYIPAGFPGIRLPGSQTLSSTGDFGLFCLQTFKRPHYSVQYSVLDLKEPFVVRGKWSERGVYTRIVLDNQVNHKIKGAGDLFIREGQFSMISAEKPEAKFFYNSAQFYSCFDVFFSIDFLKKILQRLPGIRQVFDNILFRQTEILVEPPRPANKETHQLVDNLLHSPDNEPMMETLLTQFLQQLEDRRTFKRIPTEEELKRVYDAERIIADDIRMHYLIPELARLAETNDFTIKNGFSYAYGVGPYHFLMRKRMRLARRLLEQKVPVKVIASETGYKTTADFSYAFKEYYKMRPSDFFL